jgi:hypothetical protein
LLERKIAEAAEDLTMTDEQKPKPEKRDDPQNPELNRERMQDLTEDERDAVRGGGLPRLVEQRKNGVTR